MNKSILKFRLLSYWHMGSGFGEGANLDALVIRTAAGLPFIPGRTVKGLVREAVLTAEECGRLSAGTTDELFGTKAKEHAQSRYETTPGLLCFSNATLGSAMEEWAADHAAVTGHLYCQLSSTKINPSGIAADNTLRRIEAAVPLELTAEVTGAGSDPAWKSALRTALPLLRRVGSHRHRGLGRVEVEILEVGV